MKNKKYDVYYCNVNRNLIEKANPEINKESLNHFYHWIKERYIIHLKKDFYKLEYPWTKDKILLKYKFTNVRREQDKETKWLIENICLNNELNYKNKLLNIILFRLFNKSKTIEIFGLIDFENYDKARIKEKLFEFRSKNNNYIYFSNAFFTSGPKRAANLEFDKEKNMVIKIIKLVKSYKENGIVNKIEKCRNQKEIFEALKSLPGIGNFLAYQIFVDFTYIKEFPFSENEFVVAGPGCKKGLKLFFKNFDKMNYEESLFWIRDNQDEIFKEFNYNPHKLFIDLPEYDRTLNVMSLQNCMCEFSKYMRALKGEGRPRIIYHKK